MTTEIINSYHVEFNGNKARASYIKNSDGEDYRNDKEALKVEMRKRGFLCLVTLHRKFYFRKKD